MLAIDADGVIIEPTEVASELPDTLFAGIRISAVDAPAVELLTAIGFVVGQKRPGSAQLLGTWSALRLRHK